MAAAPAARRCSAEPARMAQEPWAEPARRAVGAPRAAGARNDWVRGLERDPRPLWGRSPPSVPGGVWVAELSHLWDHQGVEEPALRCRAPPAARGERGSTPWGVDGPGGRRKGPPGRDLGGMTRPGAWMAGFPGGGGGAPRHGLGGQCLAAPGPPRRPWPLALPP